MNCRLELSLPGSLRDCVGPVSLAVLLLLQLAVQMAWSRTWFSAPRGSDSPMRLHAIRQTD